MIYIPLLILLVTLIFCIIKFKLDVKSSIIIFAGGILVILLSIQIDQLAQITDTEIWSGTVINWDHTEEYDETIRDYDSEGNYTGSHTEHHDAENRIKTSDGGWINVTKSSSGKQFVDGWPNTDSELRQIWPLGTPSSSVHTYKNKIQASYSLYRHKDIDLTMYKDLPDYPKTTHDYIKIDRIVGDFPNKVNAMRLLDQKNTELNKSIPDPDKPGKSKSWKQVNIIFVNVGADKPIEYGYALQDYWGGGNKNDFVVAVSMDNNGNISWVYPFSWSEAELLKIEVRDYISDLKVMKDTVPVIQRVSDIVADKFVRKQFADFNYLNVKMSTAALITDFVLFIIASIIITMCSYAAKF